jgi:hypothetical protein
MGWINLSPSSPRQSDRMPQEGDRENWNENLAQNTAAIATT